MTGIHFFLNLNLHVPLLSKPISVFHSPSITKFYSKNKLVHENIARLVLSAHTCKGIPYLKQISVKLQWHSQMGAMSL